MKIVGFGQQMMMEGSGHIEHEITVELEDGSRHVLPTDERTVQKLISLYRPSKLPPAAPVPPRTIERLESQSDIGSSGFDGGYDDDVVEQDPGEVRQSNRPKFLDEDGDQV